MYVTHKKVGSTLLELMEEQLPSKCLPPWKGGGGGGNLKGSRSTLSGAIRFDIDAVAGGKQL